MNELIKDRVMIHADDIDIVDEPWDLDVDEVLTAAAPTDATYCVVPTPSPSVVVSTQIKSEITAAWPKVTPAYGGAAIHKALILTRQKLTAKGYDTKDLDDWTILSVLDETYPSKSAFTFTSKYHTWTQSPAGQKVVGVLPTPTTHAVTPITTPTTTLPKLPPVAPKPKPGEIVYTGQTLGSHGAQVWRNPATGERWLFKPQKQYATDLDIATSRIQSAGGVTRPGVYDIELSGQKGSIQFMFDSDDAFPHGSFDPLKLSDQDILAFQQEQIFDWLISNFDTHSGQWIRLSPSGRLFGTDKGQAFKFFGDDVLDWDYIPVTPLGTDKLTYQLIWRAYVDGKDVDLHDPTAGPLGEYITRLMAIPDDEYRKMLSAYAQAKGKPSPQAFLDMAVARKNNLQKDFAAFWARAQAERAKHVKVPATPTPVTTTPPILSAVDLSTIKATVKWDIMEMFIASNNGVKITPAWGGAKIWKHLKDIKLAIDDPSNGIPPLTELQILKILDEVGGFKGKPKSYESVLLQWLDSPSGKKAVPSPPASLKPSLSVTTPPAPTSTAPFLDEALAALTSGQAKVPLDVFLDIEKYAPGDVIAYAVQTGGTLIFRVKRDTAFPDGVQLQKQLSPGVWEDVKHIDLWEDLSGFAKVWYTKVSDPWATGTKPVVPVPTVKPPTPPGPTVPSKIPGKGPGDTVTTSEIEQSRFLWAQGEEVARSDLDTTGGYHILISNGNGGFHLKYQTGGSLSWVVKQYPSHKPLPKTIYGQKNWKLSGSTLTPGAPSTKAKASAVPGKNAGDIVTAAELKAGAPTTSDITFLAYAYNPANQSEFRVISSFGVLKIQTRTVGTKYWNDLYDDVNEPILFGDFMKTQTWFAADKFGGEPDAYKALLPVAGKTPAGAQTPSYFAGKNVGDDVTKQEIVDVSAPPGTIIAQNNNGEWRIIIDANGNKVMQAKNAAGDWDVVPQYTFTSPAGFPQLQGWKAASGTVSKSATKAATPSTPTKTTLTGTATHIPGKSVGDAVSKDEIWDNWTHYVDGQIIATQNYYGAQMRVFVVDGKLVVQKQTKTGAWTGSDIITSKWGLTGYKWQATNDFVSPQHLKNAKKFVDKKTTPASKLPGGGVQGTGISVGQSVSGPKLKATFSTIDAPVGTVLATGKQGSYAYRIVIDKDGDKSVEIQQVSGGWKKSTVHDLDQLPAVQWKTEPGWGLIKAVPPKKFTGYAPATPAGYTPLPPAPGTAKLVRAPAAPAPVKPLIPPRLDLSGWSDAEIGDIVASRKILFTSTPQKLFADMEAVLKSYQAKGGKYSSLTLAHIIRFYDAERDKRKGLATPSYAYEQKIVTWWTQTKAKPSTTTTQVYDAPLSSRNLPPVMHRLDDPSNPNPDAQKFKAIADDEARELQRDMEQKYGRLSPASSKGVADYTGGHFREINHSIRDGTVDTSPYASHIRATVQGFRPSTRPVLLLRATGWSDFFDSRITSASALTPYIGRVFAWRRNVSTTIKRRRTYSASQDVIFDIEAPVGTPMVYAPVHGGQTSEYEMILAPHTLFRIISVEEKGGRTHVRVRVVGVADPATGRGTP